MLDVCGNCSAYTYEGRNSKGYCSYYHSYYYPTERACSSFEEGTENVWSSGGGCFLTTACCEWKGLPDDCAELTELRRFRDEVLSRTPEGRALVAEYYRIAPGIVTRLKASPEKERWMQYIYEEIQKVRGLIGKGRSREAVEAYRQMVLRLQGGAVNAPEPLCRLAEEALTFSRGPLAHQVRVIALPAGQHRVFRRMVEGWSDDFLWLTLPGLRRGALCRRLLRQEVEGFPPPDGVFVSAPQLLLPEDAAELCCAMEYYFRFALPPSLFCILTETPGLEAALSGAWGRYAARGAPPIRLQTAL